MFCVVVAFLLDELVLRCYVSREVSEVIFDLQFNNPRIPQMQLLFLVFTALLSGMSYSFSMTGNGNKIYRSTLKMEVKNDAFTRANRAARSAGADDRTVELLLPMGLVLDEDKDGNVFVKSIDKGGRAEKSGVVFEGDIVAMCSATFGDDMWSCRGVGLSRVMATIKVRNTKPVKLVLEAANEMEEKKRRAIAYKEKTEEEKKMEQAKADELLKAMVEDDKALLKKRKGLFGLW